MALVDNITKTMTELSPAAQVVLKAACIHHGLFNEEIIQRRRMLAAALRAAADQFFTDWDATRCSVFLDAIADELEGVQ